MKYSLTPIALSVLAATSLAGMVSAQQTGKPQEFRGQEPGWVTTGAPVTVRLYGQDLDPKEIQFEQPGLTGKVLKVEPFTPKNDMQKRWGNRMAEVEVTFAEGVKPGSYRFTLTGEGVQAGTGELCVDVPAPEIKEAGPNHELRKPQVLPAGSVTVMGKLDGDAGDVFRFDGKAGETWRIEVFARRLNPDTKLEAIIRLRNPRLAPVRAVVDQGNDCALEYKLPADGPYLIELFDADNRSDGNFNYRLAVRKL